MDPQAKSAVAGVIILLVIVLSMAAYTALQPPLPAAAAGSSDNPVPVCVCGEKTGGTIPPATIPQYVTYETPPEEQDTGIQGVVPTAVPILPETDIEIFNQKMAFLSNSTAISFNLKTPPMTITFNASPEMVTDTKWTISREAHKDADWQNGVLINVTRVDEESWFTLTVMDKDNNNSVVAEDGFGRQYGQDLRKQIVIRDPGDYLLDFQGDQIAVRTWIIVPREGNI